MKSSKANGEETIKVVDGRKNGRFWSYDDVFQLRDNEGEPISANAKLVYLLLCRRADDQARSWPTHAMIARDCSLSVAAVKRAINELVKINAVKVQSGKSLQQINTYTVTDKEDWYKDQEARSSERATKTEVSSSERATGVAPTELPRKTHLKEDTKRKTQPKQERSSPSLELEKEELVETFHSGIGNPKPTSGQLESGKRTINELLQDGHTMAEVNIAVQRTLANQATMPVRSFGIIPHIIGQALRDEARDKEEKAKREQQQEAKRRRQEMNDRLLEEEIARLDEEAAQKMGGHEADIATKEAA